MKFIPLLFIFLVALHNPVLSSDQKEILFYINPFGTFNPFGCDEVNVINHTLNDTTTFTKLHLAFHTFQDNALQLIGIISLFHSNITSLNVSFSNIDLAMMSDFVATLKDNTNLNVLKLSVNNLRCTECIHLAKSLRYNTSLTALDISHNHIQEKGLKAIGDLLAINPTLTYLNLNSNDFTDISNLVHGLTDNSSLQKLELESFYPEKLDAITKILACNKSITSLNLQQMNHSKNIYHWCMSDEQFDDMMKALASNPTLTDLNLLWDHNFYTINHDHIEALVNVFAENSTLTSFQLPDFSIDLNNIPFADAIAKCIEEKLSYNTSLQMLQSLSEIDPCERAEIGKILDRNTVRNRSLFNKTPDL